MACPSAEAGVSMAGTGDINADSVPDVVVGAYFDEANGYRSAPHIFYE